MFHAPYRDKRNPNAGIFEKTTTIDCRIGKEAKGRLLDHYTKMTDAKTALILMDRTMSYCSSEDGWVVRGGPAAELYEIATER